MAIPQRYTIGPRLLGDIRETITRVSDVVAPSGGPGDLHRLQDNPVRTVRLLRGTVATATWAIGETKAVTMEGSTSTVSVTNYCTPIKGDTAATQELTVVFAPVMGTMTAVEVEQPTCTLTLGGLDLTAIPNYSSGVTQVLGHLGLTATTNTVSACYHSLRWFTVTNCGVTA